MLKRLFKDTAIYGAAPYVPKIASFFVLPFVTAHLTALDYAVSGLVLAYTSSISVFGTLGLRVVLINWFYKAPMQYKWAWRQIYGFLVLWSFPFAVLTGLLIYVGIPKEAGDNAVQIVMLNLIPTVAFASTSMIANSYYQSIKQPLQIGIRTVIFGILTVFLNWYTIAILHLGYMGWFWSAFIVALLQNFSFWYPLNFILGIRPILNFKWRFIKQSLRVSLPTIPHYYGTYLLNISDRVVMDALRVPSVDIGKYNLAYTFGNYIQTFGAASGLAINPLMYECYKRNDDTGARNLVFLLQVVFLVGTFFLCLWMKEIFQILIRNAELAAMYPLAIIIVMSYNYRPMYFGANLKLMYVDKTNKLWRVTFVAGLINVVMNLALIPFFGYQAAAYVTFVSLMYMGYAGYFTAMFKKIHNTNFYPFFWMGITVVITGIAYVAVDWDVYVKILLSVLILMAGFVLYLRYNKLLDSMR